MHFCQDEVAAAAGAVPLLSYLYCWLRCKLVGLKKPPVQHSCGDCEGCDE